jgi:hypothetical protein
MLHLREIDAVGKYLAEGLEIWSSMRTEAIAATNNNCGGFLLPGF